MGVRIREKIQGSGIYWVFVNHKGWRKAKKCGSKKLANKVRDVIEANIKLGNPPMGEEEKPVMTLAQYYRTFKNNYLDTAVVKQTRLGYENSFKNHLLPYLGKFPINGIPRIKVKELVSGLVKKGYAKGSIAVTITNLGAVINHAIEDELAEKNPALRLSRYYSTASKKYDTEPLNESEVIALLEATLAWNRARVYYPLFLCSVHTGVRPAELLALKWGDIDFKGKYATIQRQNLNGKIVNRTKTGKPRHVDLSDTLIEVLSELRRQQRLKAMKNPGVSEMPEWVFCTSQGKPNCIETVREYFFKCLEKAGLKKTRYYSLRHTFASLLLVNGAPITYVSQQLGHATPRTTLAVYSHWIPSQDQHAMVNRLPSLKQSSDKSVAVSE